jgi:PDGLE domain
VETGTSQPPRSRAGWVVIALLLVIGVVVAAAFLASGDPDGLERVAEDTGFIDAGRDGPLSIIADYVFPGMDGPAATILAGVIGVAIIFALVWLVGKALARRRT